MLTNFAGFTSSSKYCSEVTSLYRNRIVVKLLHFVQVYKYGVESE